MKFCTYVKYKYASKLYTKYCMSDQYKIRKGDNLRLCTTDIFDKNTLYIYNPSKKSNNRNSESYVSLYATETVVTV